MCNVYLLSGVERNEARTQRQERNDREGKGRTFHDNGWKKEEKDCERFFLVLDSWSFTGQFY